MFTFSQLSFGGKAFRNKKSFDVMKHLAVFVIFLHDLQLNTCHRTELGKALLLHFPFVKRFFFDIALLVAVTSSGILKVKQKLGKEWGLEKETKVNP